LERHNARRRSIAERYLNEIKNPLIRLPQMGVSEEHVWHAFVLRTDYREEFIKHLQNRGIETLVYYPKAPHQQEAYKTGLVHGDLPITEKIAASVVSIPLNPIITDDEVTEVIQGVNDLFAKIIQHIYACIRRLHFTFLSEVSYEGKPIKGAPLLTYGKGRIHFGSGVRIGWIRGKSFWNSYIFCDARESTSQIFLGMKLGLEMIFLPFQKAQVFLLENES
jgi:hypothetical protein